MLCVAHNPLVVVYCPETLFIEDSDSFHLEWVFIVGQMTHHARTRGLIEGPTRPAARADVYGNLRATIPDSDSKLRQGVALFISQRFLAVGL